MEESPCYHQTGTGEGYDCLRQVLLIDWHWIFVRTKLPWILGEIGANFVTLAKGFPASPSAIFGASRLRKTIPKSRYTFSSGYRGIHVLQRDEEGT